MQCTGSKIHVSQAGKQQPMNLLKSVQFRTKHPLTFA